MKTIRKTMSLLIAIVLSLSLCIPVLATENTDTAFLSVGGNSLSSWSDAVLVAQALNEPIILTANNTLAEDLEIPSGVTLVIPYDSTLNTATNTYDRNATAYATGAYVTLTVPEGKTLTVNGTLIVNAKVQGSSNPDEGCITGTYGAMDVDGSVVVNGTLYARGYITGSGSMTVNAHATAYQLLQVRDWRGGTVTSAVRNDLFPINVFYFQNIMVPTTYEYNSTMYAQYFTSTSSTLGGRVVQGDAKLIGTSNAVFNMDEDAAIVTDYSNGALNVTTTGTVTSGYLQVTTRGTLWDYTISTEGLELPLPNMNVTVASGNFTVNSDIKMLPGSSATVAEDATLTINSGKNLYVYAAADYNGQNYAYNNSKWRLPLAADVFGTNDKTKALVEGDAALTVNGTLTANGGLYYSANGAATIGGTGTITNAAAGTTTIKECVSNNKNNIVDVTFTAYTAPAAEAPAEEAVEEPVEEIVEIEAPEFAVIEEAPLAA